MGKAVIYDLDGTIVKTERPHFDSYKRAFIDIYNIDLDEKTFFEEFTKKGTMVGEFIRKNKYDRDYNVSENEIKRVKRQYFEEIIRNGIDTLKAEGAEESLKLLYGNFPLGLGTSSSRRNTDLLMELTGFEKYFDSIITATDSKHVKPNPTCFHMVAEELEVDPKDCIVIEDAKKGIEAAKKLGMKTIWVPNDITMDHKVSPDVKLDSLNEITVEMIREL